MKKILLGLVFYLIFVSNLFTQGTTSQEETGIYTKFSIAHNYNFKLNHTLTDIGCEKIPNVLTYGSLGMYYDIKKVEITLDLGVGGMYSSKTRLVNMNANISAGYKLALPKKQNLIFAGNIAYEGYNVITRIDKGNLDFQKSILSNSTAFLLDLQQCMVGPKITWKFDVFHISVGYDFGIIPTRWKSNTVNILNSPKERIDKVHLDFAVNFAIRTKK